MWGIELAERGLLPDAVLRAGIRHLLRERLREIEVEDCERELALQQEFRNACAAGPIAQQVERANEQHYEVPAAFFEAVLGKRLKYSSGLWSDGVATLDAAEEAMLELTCRRAEIEDGMRILDLGCGWGSLSLWLAEKYPKAEILAVSNSKTQREHILARAAAAGFENLEVQTCDINRFDPERRFDRVVSVEMFEHVTNHALLLARIRAWLAPGGRLFVHHFAHRRHAYPFVEQGRNEWMARYFFSGGMMPSDAHLAALDRDLVVDAHWRVSGRHYQATAEAWLERQDASRGALRPLFRQTYGAAEADRWFGRWRIFFLACAELFGFRAGNEWFVTHLRMAPREEVR